MRILLTLVVLAAGCACDEGGDDVGGPGGSKTVVREPGTGEPNDEPLFPLRVGYRAADADGAFHIRDRVAWNGKTLFRLQLQEQRRLTDVGYSEVTAEGAMVTHLLNRDAALARPLVAIPAEVRDGMIWEAWLDGSLPAFVNQARGGQVVDTPFGPRRLWAIHTLYADGTSAGGTLYAEGIGRVGVVDPSGFVEFHDRIVVPLDDPADQPSDLPPAIALEPIGSLALAANQTLSLSALRHPGSDETTIIHRRHEYFPGLCNDIFAPGRPQALQDCYRWTNGSLETLGGAGGDSLTAIQHGADGCPMSDGSGIVPGAPGSAHSFIPRAESAQRDGDFGTTEATTQTFVSYVAIFGGEGGAGPIRLDVRNVDLQTSAYLDRLEFFLTPFGEGTSAGTSMGDFFASRLRYDLARRSGGGTAGHPEYEWLGTRAIARSGPGGGGDVLLQLRDETWIAVTGLSTDGTMPTVRPFGSRLGNVSVEAYGTEQRAIVHDRDGVLEELSLDGAGGVALRPIGRADLPDDHYVLGAVRAGTSDLVVVAGGPPYTECIDGLIPTITAWHGTVPAPGPARAPAPIDTVTATPAGLDLLVCWAPGTGEPELEGWTLAGEPARAIRAAADGSCVLVLRDLAIAASTDFRDADVAGFVRPGTFAAEGPIPGVGRVAIGVGRLEGDLYGLSDRSVGIAMPQSGIDMVYAAEPFAPLSGGGFVTHHSLYGPGLNLEGAPDHAFVPPSPDFRPRQGVVDLAGSGLWVFGQDGMLTLLSRESRRFEYDASFLLAPVAGGGILLYQPVAPNDLHAIRLWADGRTEEWSLADPGLDTSFGVRVGLEDGTICGNGLAGDSLVCVEPSGTERAIPVDDERLHTLVAGLPRFLVLPSGKIAILQELWEQVLHDPVLATRDDPTFILDPVAMTVEEIESRPVFQVSTGPDGRVWGAAWDPTRNGFPMEITDTGFVEVELPFAASVEDPLLSNLLRRETGFVLADEDVLLIWPRGDYGAGPQALSGKVLRIPLPPP